MLRDSGYGFRDGGDEFMLLLPETEQQSAHTLSLRLIDYVNRHRPGMLIEITQDGHPVALSIGIAEHIDKEPAGIFIKRADLAMYQAKKQPGCLAILAE